MSVMDKIKNMMKGHSEEAEKAVDKGAEYLNEKTHGKYESEIDAARDEAKKEFGGDQPPPPPPPGQEPPPPQPPPQQ
ncbi:antitoxin [Amycolatopsis taiwanensis]|uniref:Antitoxin n=1 Tax=Amycolatopsis taiwanensis TaxID=342230 RepID=A0A9W6VAW3_9PSEU|nr:antitoxin [Amycolatopsis taiwanensis]GLY64268.1 hypothetical protein Atai01_08870 [Amycolatopsis taiwanensis]